MKYVYTADNCPKCTTLKNKLKSEGTPYEERSADRIKNPQDKIDQEALINGSIQNMELPIVVEM